MKRLALLIAILLLGGCAARPNKKEVALRIMTGRYVFEKRRADRAERQLKAYQKIYQVDQANKAKGAGK